MEVIDTNLPEVKEFILNLTDDEKHYHDLRWNTISSVAIFVRGYRVDGTLVGIAGVFRQHVIAYSPFYMVKEAYWNKGIGTQMVEDCSTWAKEHHLPYTIIKYFPENTRIVSVLKKVGVGDGTRIGDSCYIVTPTTWKTPILFLIRCHEAFDRMVGIRLSSVLKVSK